MLKKWKKLVEVGAIAPSSRYLARRMIENFHPREHAVVVELGAGNGVFTKEILKKLPASAKLLVIEINPDLAETLRNTFNDSRIEIVTDSALNLSEILRKRNIATVEYALSGLPLGNFSKIGEETVLSEIKNCLAEHGMYIQFQYFLASLGAIKKKFRVISIKFEPRNLPPAFVLTCTKLTNRVS